MVKYGILFVLIPFFSYSQDLKLVWETDTLFKRPESVIFDSKHGSLLVSNINDQAPGKTGNGFISKLSLDGKVENLHWATGLDAPHGMTIHQDTLYVADRTKLSLIDTKSGQILKRIDIPGAKYLNDVSSDSHGEVFISDIFAKKIYNYKHGVVSVWLSLDTFSMPNGILCLKDHLKILDFAKGTASTIDYKSKQIKPFSTGTPNADGIVAIPNGYVISGAWQGDIYFVNQKKETRTLLTLNKSQVADIWYVADKNLLIVPTLANNKVLAYQVNSNRR